MTKNAPLRTLALVVALAALPAVAKDTSAEAFQSVKGDVTAFRGDSERRRFRHHYVKLVARMKHVADNNPGGSHSDDALYVAAQLSQELYETSRVRDDLNAAIAAYVHVADSYPDSNLADDALYAAAELAFERKKDAAQARALLQRIDGMESADFGPKARKMLAGLPAAEKRQQATDVLKQVVRELAQEEASDIPQVEVLPEVPDDTDEPRHVTALEHVRRPDESLVRMRVDGVVGVVRGEVPPSPDAPKRVFFDLKPAKLPKKLTRAITVGDGVVRRVRAGQFELDVVRLVIELEGDEEPSLTVERDPFELRLSVDLDKQRDNPPAVAALSPEPELDLDVVKQRLGKTGTPGGVPLSAQMGLKIRRIVLDPGHGGKDTGAIGKKGTREKDIALKIAKQVRAKIKQRLPGIDVIMTREDDTFIPLEERTRIANEAGADLFISIHCNANPSRKVRGVETYYLNITHDRYAIRLAARENAHTADTKNISDLQFILADLAMKSNVDESIRLGREVQTSVVGRLKQDWRDTRDHGLKHALFYVLMGARMPAILVETSFISNRTEESRLRSPGYRDAVADGIVRGVSRFVEQRQAFYDADAR